MSKNGKRPLVLCISGHDPTGGAGIHADIEACGSFGAHALSVITCHTVQDTSDVQRVSAVPPIFLAAQIAALAGDCAIDAVKIGLLGDAEQVAPIATALLRLRRQVVLDPVLRAGGGTALVGSALRAQMVEQLFRLADLLTPNLAEARALAGLPQGSAADCAARLLASGARNLLITGGDEPGEQVINSWHAPGRTAVSYPWPRLSGRYHGAGCTLASACAALLARGLEMSAALEQAQRYTHETLAQAYVIGQGRMIPQRRA